MSDSSLVSASNNSLACGVTVTDNKTANATANTTASPTGPTGKSETFSTNGSMNSNTKHKSNKPPSRNSNRKKKKFRYTRRNISKLKNLKKRLPEKLILTVNVLNATNLGLKNSHCNPLCCVIYDNQICTSAPIKNTNNPYWNKTFKFTLPASPKNDTIRFLIFDALDKKFNYMIEQQHARNYSNHSSISYSSYHMEKTNSQGNGHPQLSSTTNSSSSFTSSSSQSESQSQSQSHSQSQSQFQSQHQHQQQTGAQNFYHLKTKSVPNAHIRENARTSNIGTTNHSVYNGTNGVKDVSNPIKNNTLKSNVNNNNKSHNEGKKGKVSLLRASAVASPSSNPSFFSSASLQPSSESVDSDMGHTLEYHIDDSVDSFIDDQLYSNHQLLQSIYSNRKFIYMGELNLQISSIFANASSQLNNKLIVSPKFYDLQSKLYAKTGSQIGLSFEIIGKHMKGQNSTTKYYQDWSNSVVDFINSNKFYSMNIAGLGNGMCLLNGTHGKPSKLKDGLNNEDEISDSNSEADNDTDSDEDFISINTNNYREAADFHHLGKQLSKSTIKSEQKLLEIFDDASNFMLGFEDPFSLRHGNTQPKDLPNSVQECLENEQEDMISNFSDQSSLVVKLSDDGYIDYISKTLDDPFEDDEDDMYEAAPADENNYKDDIDEICTIIDDLDLGKDDSQVLMTDNLSEEDENEINSQIFQKRKKNKLVKRKKRKPQWVISKKNHASGVVIMDIIGISHLPSLKNWVRYTMDPFVILTFGRRVFKTSWKRHNLNPLFNERVIFDVYDYEESFNFDFKVIDRDSLSSHDKIAHVFIPFKQLLKHQRTHIDTINDKDVFEIPLQFDSAVLAQNITKTPILKIKFSFLEYGDLNNKLWNRIIQNTEYYDIIELSAFLEKLGDFQPGQIYSIFEYYKKAPWSTDLITKDELIEYFNKNFVNFKLFQRCPFCNYTPERTTNNIMNSKLIVENDLVTHMSVCSVPSVMKTLKASYVSPTSASRKWVSRFFAKLINGKYALGSNNANILVQDRDTGVIVDEKISAHVKLGIRVLYKKRMTPELKNFKILLKNLTIKQGLKFDNPLSIKYIESFIKFHQLDLSECLESEYKTFNEFFYRQLKPDARIPESEDPRVLISPADSRCTVFQTVSKSKELWIKGDGFTLEKLTGGLYSVDREFTIAIFRLAPQDYHRFHSPCNGVVGKPTFIEGEYYTVNPMAVRTELDVFGENTRCVIPIETEEFGQILFIPVGAMMVGSIILTRKEGETVKRGEELGYFKFGGSTILLVINKNKVLFDEDLLKNSSDCIETLVKVGMSIGHTPDITQCMRRTKTADANQMEKLKRTISTDQSTTWEYLTTNQQLEDEYNGLH